MDQTQSHFDAKCAEIVILLDSMSVNYLFDIEHLHYDEIFTENNQKAFMS